MAKTRVFRSLGIVIVTLTAVPARAADDAAPEAPRARDNATTPAPDEVSVTGKRFVETGGSVHALKEAQLRRFSYDDPHQVLLAVPGVYVRPEDGFGLRPNIGMRGANSDRSKKVTLMEDGVLFGPAPYSAPAAYYFPLVDRMKTVRVFKGPAAIAFGPHTVGGAIDFVTRDIPAARRGTYDVAVGQFGFNKQHVSYGSSDDHVGFVIEGLRLDNTGFKHIDRMPDASTGFTRNEWMVKTSYTFEPSRSVENDVELKLGYSDEVSNETYLGLSDDDLREDPNRRYLASQFDRMKWHRTQIALKHHAKLSPRLEMTTTAYRHDLARIWRKVNGFRGADISDVLANPKSGKNAAFRSVLTGESDAVSDAQTILIGPNDRTFVSQGVQSLLRGQARTGPVTHAFSYGVRAHYDEIVRKHTQDGFRMLGGELVPDGRPTQVTADNRGATHALALYVTDAATFGRLTITPGIRIEAIHASFRDTLAGRRDSATYQVVLPGVSGFYALTSNVGLLGGVHRGFSPVVPEQANTASPERSTNYELGARWASRKLRAEAVGFFNDYQNLTTLCTESNGCAGANADKQFDAGRARIAGAELFAESEANVGKGLKLPFRASYTYTYTEFLTSFVSNDPQLGNVKRGDELPYVPPHQFAGALGLESATWGANVAGTYVDAMRERAGHGAPPPGSLTDAYFLLDASVKYRLFRQLELYANGRNLLDDRYIASRRPFGARPGAPRWAMVGIRGEF